MVKIGFRKPSLRKSISARTKGRATRAIKKAIIPNYGKRGMGWAHPKRKYIIQFIIRLLLILANYLLTIVPVKISQLSALLISNIK